MKFLRQRRQRDAELDAELQSHLDESVRERTDRGDSPRAASDSARVEFGNVGLVRETTRNSWGGRWVEIISQDISFATRTLRRNPGFSLAVILALALGIGLNVTMFSVADALLFRHPAHISDPQNLVRVMLTSPQPPRLSNVGDYATYRHLADHSRLLDVAAQSWSQLDFGRGADARQVNISYVTSSYFRVLGAPILVGRTFTDQECDPENSAPIAILSYRFWQETLGGDPNVLNHEYWIGDKRIAVVGIAPKDFNGTSLYSASIWMPLGDSPRYFANSLPSFQTIGRPHIGASLQAAAAEATGVYLHSGGNVGDSIRLDPYFGHRWQELSDREQTSVYLAAVALCVLLIACANIANLFLARLIKRNHEMAVRRQLGASRGRLAGHVLAEILLLALAGSVIALALAYWGEAFARSYIVNRNFYAPNLVNWRLLASTALFALVAILFTGATSLWRASRTSAMDALKSGNGLPSQNRSALRSTLLIAQVAVTLLLTVGAGLFVRSLRNVRSVDLGFDSAHVIMAGLNPLSAGFSPQAVNANYERLAERVGALPGISSVSRTTSVPFYSYSFFMFKFSPQDTTPHRYKTFGAAIAAVDPSYFRTMGIKPSQGRVLGAGDVEGAPQVAVVTEGLVRDLWPGENPVGKCVIRTGSNVCAEIVGVTPDMRRDIENNDRSNIKGQVYLSLVQLSREKSPLAATALMIRVDAKSTPIMSRLSTALRGALPDSRYVIVEPMTDMLDSSIISWRMGASMFSFFSGLALLLTAIGLYGLLSYAVRQRTNEIGVRMALGARPQDVLRLIIAQAIKLVSAGVAIGLAASFGLSRLVASLLYRVEPSDVRSYVAATAVLTIVALIACWLPARRAARIDPLQALRYE